MFDKVASILELSVTACGKVYEQEPGKPTVPTVGDNDGHQSNHLSRDRFYPNFGEFVSRYRRNHWSIAPDLDS